MKIEYQVSGYLRAKLHEAVTKIMEGHRLALPPDVMYKALMPNNETYHVMLAASQLVKRVHTTFEAVDIVVDRDERNGEAYPHRSGYAKFHVLFPNSRYILPESLCVLTPESVLGKKLIPMLKVGQDLASLTHIFEEVTAYMPYSNVIPSVFPWVKDLVRDIKYKGDENNYNLSRWMNSVGIRTTNSAIERVKNQLTQLEIGQGVHKSPALTVELDRICKYGALAMTQFRMLDGAPIPPVPVGYATIQPAGGAEGTPESVRAEMRLVRDYYNGTK